MKFEYKSPVVTVEELTKVDVLCDSQVNPQNPTNKFKENITFDFSSFT